jgi:hypothetical protein
MSEYAPDRWVILRITDSSGKTEDRVMGGWSGGYLDPDSWRLNSGCTRVVDTDDGWDVYGASGSVYHLHRSGVGVTGLMGSVIATWERQGATIKVIDIADLRTLSSGS